MTGQDASTLKQRVTRARPWLILALAVVPAVWHVVDFEDDIDGEFPTVQRPTFSRRPPSAYRLAEPGDTLDRMAIYAAAAGVVLASAGAWRGRGRDGLWPAAIGLSLAALWHASTPGPTFDGWHGIGWRATLDPDAPPGLRLLLAGAAVGLAAIGAGSRATLAGLRERGRALGVNGLLVVALVLVALRQVEVPGVEPAGYWPRWSFFWGLLAFDLALVRALPRREAGRRAVLRLGYGVAGAGAWLALVVGGVWLTWYHRPLERLRAVVPGRIYISAMPTALGLRVADGRHHFRTIINLFPEDTAQRSDRLPDELRFVRERGIRYVSGDSNYAASADFLDRTLALANDPDAWPMLVHCHGCMDRSPAWMGIYRFVVQGRPLAEVFREIERHRGYRPKASVTLLFDRVLPPRAPGRYAADPTAPLLRRATRDAPDWHVRPDAPATADGGRREPVGRGPCLGPRRPSGRATELDTRAAIARVPEVVARLAFPRIGHPIMIPRTPLSAVSGRTGDPPISSLMQAALANPGLVSLAAGFVDQQSLPVEATARAVAALLGDPREGRRALQYGTTAGDLALRALLLARLEREERVPAGTFEHLLPRTVVTTGSQQLLYLVAEALLDPGDIVLVESPTYFVFLGVLESRGARVIGVEADAGGLRIDALEATLAAIEARGELDRVKLIYTVSEHSNPTGISLADDRRAALVALARRHSREHRIYVLEDAAYRGLTFAGAEPPSVWGHDAGGETVILARTFSKTFSPGLKTGYGILPEDLVGPVLRLKGNHDFGSGHFAQQLLGLLIADGTYDRHVAGLVATYARKRDAMLAALDEHFAPFDGLVTWTRPVGGIYVWVTFPDGLDTGPLGPLFSKGMVEGVLYVPGAYCFADAPGPAPTNHARLCFGVPGADDLAEGVRRLAGALAECLDPVA